MKKLLTTTVFLALAGGAAADGTIVEQIFDGGNGIASERNTAVTLSTTADDFVISDKNRITAIFATFLVTTDPLLVDWEFDVYADGGGIPGDLIAVGSGGAATDTGDIAFGLAVHNVHFNDISIGLDPGTYWIGIRGVGQNQGERAFWGTANYGGSVNGSPAHVKSDFFGFPEWTDVTEVFGVPFDTAFTLHGVPAPGALAFLAVAGLAARRRRRA